MKTNYSEFDVGGTTRNINCTMWFLPKYSLAKNPCASKEKDYPGKNPDSCTMWWDVS